MATRGGVLVWTGTARDQSAHGISNDVGSVQGTHGDPLPGWFSANGDHIHVLELATTFTAGTVSAQISASIGDTVTTILNVNPAP